MKHKYTLFNIACLLISTLFVFGILWLWRGSFVNVYNKEIPSVSVAGKRELADYNREKNNTDIITENEVLPKEINLPVPFTSQAPEENWDEPWQDACEEAALLMMDAYYKEYNLSPLFVRDEIIKMVEWEEKQGWDLSIEITKMGDIMTKYLSVKYKPKIIENPTVEQIKKYVASGHPVLVVADGKALPNPHFRNGGPVYHALVIRGYTGDSFITNDPGTKFGENFKYKYEDLLRAVHDWNNGDVKNGRQVVLVLP